MTSDLSPQEKQLKQSSRVFFGNCVKSEAGLAQTQRRSQKRTYNGNHLINNQLPQKEMKSSPTRTNWEQKGHPEHKVLVPMPLSVITVILLRQIMTKNIQKLA
jgi:hypothetical protein